MRFDFKRYLTFNPVVLIVVTALLAVAVEPIVVKMGYGIALDPFALLTFRFISGAIVILPFMRGFQWVKGVNLLKMMEVAFLFAITNIFIYLSLRTLSAIAVITIVTTTPAFVALVNQGRKKETLSATFWPAFLLCFLGVLFTLDAFFQDYGQIRLEGVAFISLAVIGSTIYRTRMDGLTATFKPSLIANYIFLLNGIAALFFVPMLEFEALSIKYVHFGLWLGGAAVLGNVAFLYALKLLGSTRISVIGILQRPLLIILSAIILKETVDFGQIFGIALVLIGVTNAKVKKNPPRKVSAVSQAR